MSIMKKTGLDDDFSLKIFILSNPNPYLTFYFPYPFVVAHFYLHLRKARRDVRRFYDFK